MKTIRKVWFWMAGALILALLSVGPFAQAYSPAPNPNAEALRFAPTATPVIPVPFDAYRLSFERGTTYLATYNMPISTNQTLNFVLRAMRDQRMDVGVWPNSVQDQSLNLTIFGSATGAILTSQTAIRPDLGQSGWGGVLPATQDYVIQITNRGPATSVTLTVSIPARIRFAWGATSATVTGRLPTVNVSNLYFINARQGQHMVIRATAPTNSALISVVAPDGSPLQRWDVAGAYQFDWILPASGDYLVGVISYTQAPVDYTLSVSITN